MDPDDIAHRFDYHPPRSQARVEMHESVREWVGNLAGDLNHVLPDGREKSLVITHLEQAAMWANAALARAPDPDAEVTHDEAAAGPRGYGDPPRHPPTKPIPPR